MDILITMGYAIYLAVLFFGLFIGLVSVFVRGWKSMKKDHEAAKRGEKPPYNGWQI